LVVEKYNSKSIVGEMKTKFDLLASKNLSVSWKNGESSTEVQSLKSMLNESKGMTQDLHEKRIVSAIILVPSGVSPLMIIVLLSKGT
jgi:hypothetical protein